MTKTNIIVNLQVDGLHSWPDARRVFPEVGFLADVHRHMFHVQLKKRVTHDDRDVEFIMFKRDVLDYLHLKYFRDEYNCHFFGAMSCEMIASFSSQVDHFWRSCGLTVLSNMAFANMAGLILLIAFGLDQLIKHRYIFFSIDFFTQ